MGSWYEDDSFWETWARYMFAVGRMSTTGYEAERAIELLDLKPGDHVLDVCCGMGRHMLELRRRGYRVTGIDRVKSYLEAARDAATREGLEVELIEQDVRRFELPQTFDGAINMYTSFGYFEDQNDNLRMATNIRKSLKAGRRLLIQTEGKEIMARDYRPREWYRHDDGSIGLQERTIRDGWEMMDTRWMLLRGGRLEWDGVVSSRIYSAAEMRALLHAAGFAKVNVFGSLAGTAYDDSAGHLVAVATV
jgi:SAM-dependent methyltransferase